MKISLSPATPEAWSGSVLALGIPKDDPQGLVAAMELKLLCRDSDPKPLASNTLNFKF